MLGDLLVNIATDTTAFDRGVNETRAKATSLGGFLSRAFSFTVGQGMFSLIQSGIENAGKLALGFNATMEQNKLAFTTMLGSEEKAVEYLQKLQVMAAKTPFEFKDLTDATKRLMAFGFEAKDIPKMMTAIGDTASAMGLSGSEGLNRIGRALGQMRAKGRVSSEEMTQLAEVGIPAWEILSKATGKSTAELIKLASQGVLPAKEAIDTLIAGMEARFPGMMAKQSQTFNGLVSTVKDNVSIALGAITSGLFDKLKGKIEGVAELTNKFREDIQKGGIDFAIKEVVPESILKGMNTFLNLLKGIASNIKIVKGALASYIALLVIYKGIKLVVNTYEEIHNALLLISILRTRSFAEAQLFLNGTTVAGATAIGGTTLATKLYTVALNVAKFAQITFNAICAVNPWVWVAGAVVLVVGALLKITGAWDKVTGAIKGAWKWLTNWNSTRVEDKVPNTGTNSSGGTVNWKAGQAPVSPTGGKVTPKQPTKPMTKEQQMLAKEQAKERVWNNYKPPITVKDLANNVKKEQAEKKRKAEEEKAKKLAEEEARKAGSALNDALGKAKATTTKGQQALFKKIKDAFNAKLIPVSNAIAKALVPTSDAKKSLDNVQKAISLTTQKIKLLKEEQAKLKKAGDTAGANSVLSQIGAEQAKLAGLNEKRKTLVVNGIKDSFAKQLSPLSKTIKDLIAGANTKDLQANFDKLTEAVTKQKQKITTLQAEYKKIVAVKGEMSSEAKAVASAIDKESEALDRLQVSADKAKEKLEDATKKIDSMNSALINALRKKYEGMRDAELGEFDKLIKGVDEKIKKLNDEYNKKKGDDEIADLQKRLSRTRGSRERADLQKEIDDKLEQQAIDAEVSKLELEKQGYEDSKAERQKHYDKLLEQDSLALDARKLILSKNQEEIVSLITNYGDAYELAGKSLGQALADGFDASASGIKTYIGGLIEDVGILLSKLPGVGAIMGNTVGDWRINTSQSAEEEYQNPRAKITPMPIRWNADGGIYDRKAIVGLAEAGTEAVVPLDRLQGMIDKSVKDAGGDGLGQIILHIENFFNSREQDVEDLANEFSFYLKKKRLAKGGRA